MVDTAPGQSAVHVTTCTAADLIALIQIRLALGRNTQTHYDRRLIHANRRRIA
jgi:hypothetical protein